jgi:hypothetical protein
MPIEQIGFELIKIISEEFNGKYRTHIESYQYAAIDLHSGFNIRFTRWGEKPYYIIAFYKDKYLFELDLSRIIVEVDEYTWFLNIPTHQTNKKFLTEILGSPTELPPWYREKVTRLKQELTSGTVVRKTGYLLCHRAQLADFKERFIDILKSALNEHRRSFFALNNTDQPPNTYDDAVEGQSQDHITTSLIRNRKIVQLRKEKDDYTCQACGFKLFANGINIIDCHHINPLSDTGMTLTSIDQLVCLCPTCHRIAHTRKNPLSVEEIKDCLKSG